LATVVSTLSPEHSRYLVSGCYGFIVGDGFLYEGVECVTELFYRANIFSDSFYATANYQFIVNPGYNQDRGPAHVLGLRVHIEF